MKDRIQKAYDWWLNEGFATPTPELYAKLIKGLESIENPPRSIQTALVVANDEKVRTWAIIVKCFQAAIDEQIPPGDGRGGVG